MLGLIEGERDLEYEGESEGLKDLLMLGERDGDND
jgi:hypothetical protein